MIVSTFVKLLPEVGHDPVVVPIVGQSNLQHDFLKLLLKTLS